MINSQKLRKIALFIGAFYLPNAFSADAAVLLNNQLSEIHTLQSDFVQTITDGQGKQLSQSEGRLALERPGKFRWEVMRPEKQLIIATNKKIKVYDPSLQQMIVRPMPEHDSNLPALLLSRTDVPPDRHFYIRLTNSNPKKFHLTPKKKDSLFAAFYIEFKNNALDKLTFTDHLSQTTTVIFKHEKRNQPLPADEFELIPPKGTDIIYDKTD